MRNRQLSVGIPGNFKTYEITLLSRYRDYVRKQTKNFFMEDSELDELVMREGDFLNPRKILVASSPKKR